MNFGVKQKLGERIDEDTKEDVKQSLKQKREYLSKSGRRVKSKTSEIVRRAEQAAREFEDDVRIEIEETQDAYIRLELYYKDNHITSHEVDGDDLDSVKNKAQDMVDKVRERKQDERDSED